MFTKFKQSMVYKVSILLSLIITIMATIIVFIVLSNGVLAVLKQQPSMAFSKEVETNKSFIKDQLMLGLGNITAYSTDIENIYNTKIDGNSQLSDEQVIDFLFESVPIVVNMLGSAQTTGAFIILNNDGLSNEYTTLFLRDPAPDVEMSVKKDFLIQFAPTKLVDKLDYEKMNMYKPNITLDGIHKNILTVPIEREIMFPNNKEIGYWQVAPDFANAENSIVTYSIPLVDNNGNIFGVIGMGITENFLFRHLPESKMGESKTIGYSLGIYDKDKDILKSVLNYGTNVENNIAPLYEPMEFSVFDKDLNLYNVKNIAEPKPIVSSIHYLNLYKDTPFNHLEWVFIGYAEENDLLEYSNKFIKYIIMTFISVLIIGLLLSYFFAKKISKPITDLAKKMSTNDSKIIHSLIDTKTGYGELDELTKTIVHFSKKEKESSLKTNKIIRMVNLPLGTFEYNKNNDYVICSNNLIDLFEFDKINIKDNMVKAKQFFDKMDEIKLNVENKAESIYMIKSKDKKWLKIVSAEVNNSILGICLDVTKDILEKHIMEYERDFDRLTKLLNRDSFRNKVEKIFENDIIKYAAFIMFDIDSLKYINDTYGHDMGDYYISSIANILSNTLSDNCLVARMSGDEFYVFAQSNNSKDEIRDLVKSVYEAFDINFLPLPDGNQLKMRMSSGIAWYGDDSNSIDELIHYADFAMYQVKHTQKGELEEFNKAVYLKNSFMLNGSGELNRILDEELVDYVFQVIVSGKTGEIYGYEALMRPKSKIIDSPIKLLKIATIQSKLYNVEKITLNKTLEAYVKYSDLFNGKKLFVNSIPNEILSDIDFMDVVNKYSQIFNNIVLEITEGEKLNINISDKKIAMARKYGMMIALDDYGSGYCSNVSLLKIDPDIIKLDQMMIKNISTDKNRQAMFLQIMDYAKQENIAILAEGVETFEDMQYLVSKNVDFLQGYYITKPTALPNYDETKIKNEISIINSLKENN